LSLALHRIYCYFIDFYDYFIDFIVSSSIFIVISLILIAVSSMFIDICCDASCQSVQGSSKVSFHPSPQSMILAVIFFLHFYPPKCLDSFAMLALGVLRFLHNSILYCHPRFGEDAPSRVLAHRCQFSCMDARILRRAPCQTSACCRHGRGISKDVGINFETDYHSICFVIAAGSRKLC